MLACVPIVVLALVVLALVVLAPPFAVAQEAPDADDPAAEQTTPDEPSADAPASEVQSPDDADAKDEESDDAKSDDAKSDDAKTDDAESDDAKTDETATDGPEPEGADAEPGPWDVSKPCVNYQHPYEADLCQQWRTAEAAERTAAASARTASLVRLVMLLGVIATLLLLLLFVPIVMAALAVRRTAANATPAYAPAMDRMEETRAYVDVDKIEFIEAPESEGVIKVKVVFRNSGQTPAFSVKTAVDIGTRDISDETLVPVMPLPDRSALESSWPRLGRDATVTEIVQCESTPSLADRVMGGESTILVWGFVEYVDVTDRTRKTAFQYLCNAETLESGQMFKPMLRGDEVN